MVISIKFYFFLCFLVTPFEYTLEIRKVHISIQVKEI